jgi:hypothetical protein
MGDLCGNMGGGAGLYSSPFDELGGLLMSVTPSAVTDLGMQVMGWRARELTGRRQRGVPDRGTAVRSSAQAGARGAWGALRLPRLSRNVTRGRGIAVCGAERQGRPVDFSPPLVSFTGRAVSLMRFEICPREARLSPERRPVKPV